MCLGKVFAREATVCLGGLALCAVLNTGIYQFYSIFGSLLWEADPVQFSKSRVQVARLSPSGYQLWICVASRDPLRGDSRSPGGFYSSDRRSVTLVQPVVKSVNSILSSHVRSALQEFRDSSFCRWEHSLGNHFSPLGTTFS